MLKISSKLHFNGQGGASNDEMDSTVAMAWTGTSVYDRHIKHALHHADESALVRNVRNNDAASSYVLHLRQSHRSPAQLVEDSCCGLGRTATCFQSKLSTEAIYNLVVRRTEPSAIGIEMGQILGGHLMSKAITKAVKLGVGHVVSVSRGG